MLNIMSGMIVNYLKCARRVCVCTSVRVYESEIHGVWRQRGEGYNFLSNLVQFPIVCILLYFVLYFAVF